LGTDDAAIYVPGIKQAADPALYPFGAEFFQSHASLTILPLLVCGSARITHMPIDWAIFVWHAAGIFLLLFAAWRLLSACFENDAARWAGVALLAALLAVPVAGTALSIADPYVTSRTLSTPATLFSIACYVSGHRKRAAAWWLFTTLIHPQMGAYAAVFLGSMVLVARWVSVSVTRPAPAPSLSYLAALPFLFDFQPVRGPAREALLSRTYFFVSQWTWYEWVGIFAPLALLAWFAIADFRGTRPAFRALSRTLPAFGLLFTACGFALTLSPHLENYTRLQPMRAFHLVYVVFFVLLGGVIGEYVLRNKLWRWLGLFVPLGLAICLMQVAAYPASAHVELPSIRSASPWGTAFLWIRNHTPKDAVFALDPEYMKLDGEDMHGFRAIAERSVLADEVKDSGAVSLFPGLAAHWKAQVDSVRGWRHFHLSDFQRLAGQYPVTWFVTERPSPAGLLCPYQNQAVAVCRLAELTTP
jgi:hypothetical protein